MTSPLTQTETSSASLSGNCQQVDGCLGRGEALGAISGMSRLVRQDLVELLGDEGKYGGVGNGAHAERVGHG